MARVTTVAPDDALAALEADGMRVTEWTDDPGAHYPAHSHSFREVRIVLEGRMTIVASGQRFDLGPGDRIDLDAGEVHEATVDASGVHYLAGSGGARG